MTRLFSQRLDLWLKFIKNDYSSSLVLGHFSQFEQQQSRPNEFHLATEYAGTPLVENGLRTEHTQSTGPDRGQQVITNQAAAMFEADPAAWERDEEEEVVSTE